MKGNFSLYKKILVNSCKCSYLKSYGITNSRGHSKLVEFSIFGSALVENAYNCPYARQEFFPIMLSDHPLHTHQIWANSEEVTFHLSLN